MNKTTEPQDGNGIFETLADILRPEVSVQDEKQQDENKELQALQNMVNSANVEGMRILEHYEQDKRKTGKKYYLTIKGTTASPTLDYNTMNHFILGYIKISKHNTTKQ